MFVLKQPQHSKLPEEFFEFGDPEALIHGVIVTESSSEKTKTIHSLYELELQKKYYASNGEVSIKRISDSRMEVTKKGSNNYEKRSHGVMTSNSFHMGPFSSKSSPIPISSNSYPLSSAHIPIPIPSSRSSYKSGYHLSSNDSEFSGDKSKPSDISEIFHDRNI